MRRKLIRGQTALIGAGIALFVIPVQGLAQDTRWNRYTIEGLEGVYVQGDAAGTCTAHGVEPAALEELAQAHLGERDVPLLTREEMLAMPGLPELRLTVECSEPRDSHIGYSVSVRIQQAATMVRDAQVSLPEAVTWYRTTAGVSPANALVAAVDATLTDTLADFATAWEAAHAEPGGAF